MWWYWNKNRSAADQTPPANDVFNPRSRDVVHRLFSVNIRFAQSLLNVQVSQGSLDIYLLHERLICPLAIAASLP